jgi:hypothetical protein
LATATSVCESAYFSKAGNFAAIGATIANIKTAAYDTTAADKNADATGATKAQVKKCQTSWQCRSSS